MIVLPISWLVYYSLTAVDPDTQVRSFTLAQFRTLFSDPEFIDPLITTCIVAVSSSVACCVLAAPMGWLVARTDMPLRRTIRALVTASFVTPPFLGAIAWTLWSGSMVWTFTSLGYHEFYRHAGYSPRQIDMMMRYSGQFEQLTSNGVFSGAMGSV